MLQEFRDETLYSIVSRLFISLNLHSPSDINQLLFGKDKKRIHFYLPSQIRRVGNFFNIEAIDLLKKNSLYPLYERFLPREHAEQLKVLMLEEGQQRVPTNVIEASSPVFAPYQLKCCEKCIQEDVTSKGTAYWKIVHQVPLLNICPYHKCKMKYLEGGDSGISGKYVLPTNSENTYDTLGTKLGEIFSNTTLYFLENDESFSLYEHYLNLLSNNKLLRGQSLNIKELAWMYENAMCDDESFVKALSLPQMLRILRDPLLPVHPVKHLITLSVFESCGLNSSVIGVDQASRVRTVNSEPIQDDEEGIKKFYKRQPSINSTAKRFGISRSKIKRILKANHVIPISTLERKIILKALMNVDRALIAEEMKVSVGYVEQVISYEPRVVEHRMKLKATQLRVQYQDRVILYVKSHPQGSIAELKKNLNKEYHWLYRNQKEWLDANIYRPKKVERHPRSKGDVHNA